MPTLPTKKKNEAGALTSREELFVLKVLALDNVTEAYLQAGYKCTRDAAAASGARLLGKVRVAQAVKAARERRVEQLSLDVDAAMRHMNAVVRFDPTEIYDDQSRMKPFREWPEELRRTVRGVEEKQYGTKVIFPDKQRAAERILEGAGKLKPPSTELGVGSDLAALLAGMAKPQDVKT